MDLRKFLHDHEVKKGSTFTHTSMTGGSYFIGDDELDTFFSLYVEHIENNLGSLHLTEKSTPVGPPRVDLDFIYPKDILKHQHTQDQTLAFVKAYMNEIQKYVQVPEGIEIYIMEKARPTIDEKGRSKSGVHILVPDLRVTSNVETSVRRTLLSRMPEFFPNLPLTDPWDKVYDPSPLTHTAQWTLYGSLKKDGLPYRISYVVDWTPEEMTVDTSKPSLTADLIKRLSVRAGDETLTPLTEFGRKAYENVMIDNGERISGGRAAHPTRGRPAQRGAPGSRGSSPGAGPQQRPLSDEEREFIRAHVKNLAPFRHEQREPWRDVGICLKNIHVDLLDCFLDFSSQWKDFNESDCMRDWQSFGFRIDGARLGMGSLLYWSRMDNPEGYEVIRDRHIESLVDAAQTSTEYDVARVVHAKFRDRYKCAKYANNEWYRYNDVFWEETDRGVHLQCMLSSEIWKLFLKREMDYGQRLSAMDPCEHKKELDMACSFCKTNYMKSAMNRVCLNLKKTKFKENVMRECRELFLDEQFATKADSNNFLVAFNNGVYDLNIDPATGKRVGFREGKPEDYITFSTRVDYDPERSHTDFECWPEIQKFFANILPDREVREYYLKHLASCLIGGNQAQKFHIETGSGSNGKSMVHNLASKAFGDYSCKAPISLITQGRNKSSAPAPEMVRLKGRRFVTMQEPDEGAPLNTGILKEIASGEPVIFRDLYAGSKAMVEFTMQAKFHLACNEKPKIQTTDGGTWRRLVVINFGTKFVADPREPWEMKLDETLQFKVVSVPWAQCFLHYLVHILETEDMNLVPPAKIMEYTNEYQAENDSFARFILEHLETIDTTQDTAYPELVTKTELSRQFKAWKDINGVRADPKDLIKRVEAKYGRYPKDGWSNFRISNRMV